MPDPLNGLFELLMARIRALEADMANMREELDEVRAEVCDGWLGGTD